MVPHTVLSECELTYRYQEATQLGRDLRRGDTPTAPARVPGVFHASGRRSVIGSLNGGPCTRNTQRRRGSN